MSESPALELFNALTGASFQKGLFTVDLIEDQLRRFVGILNLKAGYTEQQALDAAAFFIDYNHTQNLSNETSAPECFEWYYMALEALGNTATKDQDFVDTLVEADLERDSRTIKFPDRSVPTREAA